MIPGAEAIYERIGVSVANTIVEPWSEMVIEATFFKDSTHFEGEYRTTIGKLRSVATTMECNRAFRELRRMFNTAGHPAPGQATFSMTPDGKFQMKWGYDNCDSDGFTVVDDASWQRRQEDRRLRFLKEAS